MNFIHMALRLFNISVFRRSSMMKQIKVFLFQCICNYNHWGICEIQTQTLASVSFPSALDSSSQHNSDIRRWSVFLKETGMQLLQAHQTKLNWNNDGELTNTGPEHHADVMHFWLVFQLSPLPLVSRSAVNVVVVVMSMCTIILRVIIPSFRHF